MRYIKTIDDITKDGQVTFGDLRPNELRTLRRFDERLHGMLPKPANTLEAMVRYFGDVL